MYWGYTETMTNNIREKLSTFKQDHLRIVIAVTNTILAISMTISPEPRNFFFWFTLVFRIMTVPVSLFIGNKGIWVLYFIFCNVKALDITYNNLTIVGILSVLFALTPKVTKHKAILIVSLYITDVFIVAGLHNKTPFYIYTHILLSIQYCTAMWKQKVVTKEQYSVQTKILILTQDEIKILEQLINGEPIKQVDGFSEATTYRKLTEARDRNGIENNERLIEIYRNNK